MPNFWDRIESAYKAKEAHEFLLHLNVRDLALDEAYGYLPMRDFLMEQLNKVGCDMVLSYSRSEGVAFADLKTRSEYQNILGLTPVEALAKPEGAAQPQRRRINAAIQGSGQAAEQSFPRAPREALPMLERLFRQRVGDLKVGLILDFVEKIAPNGAIFALTDETLFSIETLERWAMDLELKTRNHIILLLCANLADVSPALSLNNNVEVIQVPLPNHKERLDFIRHLQTLKDPDLKLSLQPGLSDEGLANSTGGLSLFSIHDAYLNSKKEKKPLALNALSSRLKSSIKSASRGFLEVVETAHGFENIGGLHNVVSYLKEVIEGLKSRDFKRVPMGILFLGPPGSGKTLISQALAKESGMNFVKLKIARERWAPQTEGDLALALDLIRSLAPVVVFIDELDRIDQIPSILDRSRSYLRSQLPIELLQFMSDISLKGQVLWIGATNRPDKLDMSVRRLGTFDDKIPFLVPDATERAEIFQKIFAKNQIPYERDIDFGKAASDQLTSWHTGAELEVVVNRSYRFAKAAKRDRVSQDDLLQAASDFIPGYSVEVYEFMSLLALKEVNSHRILPKNLPIDLKERIYQNGSLSKWKIDQRLRELEATLKLQELRSQEDLR